MRKRLLVLLLAGVMAAGLFGGCGSRKTGADTTTDKTAEESKESVETENTGENSEESWEENGNTYTGFEVIGQIDGEGICYYADGSHYDGEWKDGKREGEGCLYITGGGGHCLYKGEFKNDLMDGYGEAYWRQTIYAGEWKSGIMEGHGSCYWPSDWGGISCICWEGEWKAGERTEEGGWHIDTERDPAHIPPFINTGFPVYFPAEPEKPEDIPSVTALQQSATTESAISNPASAETNPPAEADYDDVEMGDNMLQAAVDGEKMTFYLERENTSSDGYELSYISFTPEGEANYKIYLRIPLRTKAGTYSGSSGKACYFSLSTRYNEEKGKWGDSYKMVHYGSSSSKDIGTYSFTLDSDIGFEYSEGSGSFEAEMEGSSSSTEGKSVSISDGVFRFAKGDAHELVQAWQDGSLSRETGTWIDPYQGTDKKEKKLCTKCGGTGKVICSVCDGEGTLVRRKDSVDLGSGSTGYTETVKCACNNGYYDCSRCGGDGYTD